MSVTGDSKLLYVLNLYLGRSVTLLKKSTTIGVTWSQTSRQFLSITIVK